MPILPKFLRRKPKPPAPATEPNFPIKPPPGHVDQSTGVVDFVIGNRVVAQSAKPGGIRATGTNKKGPSRLDPRRQVLTETEEATLPTVPDGTQGTVRAVTNRYLMVELDAGGGLWEFWKADWTNLTAPDQGLRYWGNEVRAYRPSKLGDETRRKIFEAKQRFDRETKSQKDALSESMRITAEDLAVFVGPVRVTAADVDVVALEYRTENPRQIIERHKPERSDVVTRLAADMQSRGWQGRPVLVLEWTGDLLALTASHRLEAAKVADLDEVPVAILHAQELYDAVISSGEETSEADWTIQQVRSARYDSLVDLLQRYAPEAAGLVTEELVLGKQSIKISAADVADDRPTVIVGNPTIEKLEAGETVELSDVALIPDSELFSASRAGNLIRVTAAEVDIVAELTELAKAAATFDEFRRQIQQRHLTDLSSQLFRYGRAFPVWSAESAKFTAEDAWQGVNQSYTEDIKYSAPGVYKAIMSPSPNITVWRAVPKQFASQGVRVGDYVALDKTYAQMHGDSVLEGQQKEKSKLVSAVVPKRDVIWGEADWSEWAYSPQPLRQQVGTLEDFYKVVHGKQATAVRVTAAMLQSPPAMLAKAKEIVAQAVTWFTREALDRHLTNVDAYYVSLPNEVAQADAQLELIPEQMRALGDGNTERFDLPRFGPGGGATAIEVWRRPSYASNPSKYHVNWVRNGERERFQISDALDLDAAILDARNKFAQHLRNVKKILSNYEDTSKSSPDDAIAMWLETLPTSPPLGYETIDEGKTSIKVELPVDLSGWSYANQVNPQSLPPAINLEVYSWRDDSQDRGSWLPRQPGTMIIRAWDGARIDEALDRAIREAQNVLEHEFAHVAQSLLQWGKELEHPAGVPSGGEQDHKQRGLEHSQRPIEFYPNLVTELRDFEQSAKDIGLTPQELQDYARKWVVDRPRFKELRNYSEDRWQKAVTEFMRSMGQGQGQVVGASLLRVTAADLTARKEPDKAEGEFVGVFIRLPDEIADQFPPKEEDPSPPHFTMLALEPMDPARVGALKQVVDTVTSQFAPFAIALAPGVDYFESSKDGKQIAHKGVAAASVEAMTKLHDALESAVEAAGFETKHYPGPFKAHSTLEYGDAQDYAGPVPEGSFTANEVEIWGFNEDVVSPLKRAASTLVVAYHQNLSLRRVGFQRYVGTYGEHHIKIGGDYAVQHGSYPGNQRQRRQHVWRVSVNGEDAGTAETFKAAQDLAIQAASTSRNAARITYVNDVAERGEIQLDQVHPGDKVRFKEESSLPLSGSIATVSDVEATAPSLQVILSSDESIILIRPEQVELLVNSRDPRV